MRGKLSTSAGTILEYKHSQCRQTRDERLFLKKEAVWRSGLDNSICTFTRPGRFMRLSLRLTRLWFTQSCLPFILLLIYPIFQAPAQPNLQLPTVVSYAIDKSKVTLPADLSGAENVLILYFEPDQNSAALAWQYGIESVRAQHANFPIYLLPVYGRENFLARWWIDAFIRSNAPATQDRRLTIPLFVDKKNFLAALAIENEMQPVVLLTDKAGHVQWKQQGEYDRSRLPSLEATFADSRRPGH